MYTQLCWLLTTNLAGRDKRAPRRKGHLQHGAVLWHRCVVKYIATWCLFTKEWYIYATNFTSWSAVDRDVDCCRVALTLPSRSHLSRAVLPSADDLTIQRPLIRLRKGRSTLNSISKWSAMSDWQELPTSFREFPILFNIIVSFCFLHVLSSL